MYSDEEDHSWQNFIHILGGLHKVKDKSVLPLSTVLQTSELLGLVPSNALSGWKRPKGNEKILYNAALDHARSVYHEHLSEEEIEKKILEVEAKLKYNPIRQRILNWLRYKPSDPAQSRSGAFKQSLVEHWAYQFAQIAELYGETQYTKVLPSIYFTAMQSRW